MCGISCRAGRISPSMKPDGRWRRRLPQNTGIGRDVPILYDDRLREMSFGDYEGTENSFSIPDCPVNVIFQHPEAYTESVGGAETFEELFARTGAFLEEVIDPLMAEGKNVLIVGHGAMNLSIISRIRHLPISEFWSGRIKNCEMIRLI